MSTTDSEVAVDGVSVNATEPVSGATASAAPPAGTAHPRTTAAHETVEMFADRPGAGGALTVVPDAADLDDGILGAVARDSGTPETAFVLAPRAPTADYRVRVFTPTGPSPYGSHAAAGVAATLVRTGRLAPGRVVQECGDRLLTLDARPDAATLGATGATTVRPLPDDLTAALLDGVGLVVDDLLGPAAACGFGPEFHVLSMRAASVAAAVFRPAAAVWAQHPDALLVAWDPVTRTAHTRMFAPGYDLPEDPACASAALALGPWLVHTGGLPRAPGTYGYVVRQGVEMGRPSTLHGTVTVGRTGDPGSATVTGDVRSTAADPPT